MTLIEELQSLDINDIGRWPLVFRAAVIVLVFIVVTFLVMAATLMIVLALVILCIASWKLALVAAAVLPPRTSSARQRTTMPTKCSLRRSNSLLVPC